MPRLRSSDSNESSISAPGDVDGRVLPSGAVDSVSNLDFLVIVLVIDEPTPSINVHMGHHWSKKHELRQRWGWLTKRAIRRANLWVPPKWKKAEVRIERYGARILDSDNFRAGTKFLMDSLVQEGIIVDDKPAVIGEPKLTQFAGKERKTIVYVEQVA